MVESDHQEAVLVSVKPKFAAEIARGKKTVEFRRRRFGRSFRFLLVYSSSPVRGLVCSAEVTEIVEASPSRLWKRFGAHGMIEKEEFDAYYEGSSTGCAICLNQIERFASPVPLDAIRKGLLPPQSYMYIDREAFRRLFAIATN